MHHAGRSAREEFRVEDVRLVRWRGRITGNAEFLDRSAFTGWLEEGERRFVFNLSQVTRVDSFAIGVLVACVKRGRTHDAVIKLVLSKLQIELFELLRLGGLFQLYEREDEALGDFTRPPA